MRKMGHTICFPKSNIGIHADTFNHFEHGISPTTTRLTIDHPRRFSKVDMNTHKTEVTAIYLQTDQHDAKDKKLSPHNLFFLVLLVL